MITIRINLMARPGKRRELMQSVRELKNKIAKETGCIESRVYQNPDSRDEFVILEQWENEELARAHLDSDNLAVLVGAGSVLSQDVGVSVTKIPSLASLEQMFNKRVVKKDYDPSKIYVKEIAEPSGIIPKLANAQSGQKKQNTSKQKAGTYKH